MDTKKTVKMTGENFTEEDFTEEETMQQIRENEDSLLESLLAAADYATNEERIIEIIRGGKSFFSFTIHPISEDTIQQIRKKYTNYAKNRRTGTRVADELDVAKFRCSMIYNSTIDKDKEKIWDNKELQESLRRKGYRIINALDVIEAVLLPGEKDKIMEAIDCLSGYGEDEDDMGDEDKRIETAKN